MTIDELTKAMCCPCGMDLADHRRDPAQLTKLCGMVANLGGTIQVITPAGTWLVPRIYIALHGLSADDLPAIAAQFGFERQGRGDA